MHSFGSSKGACSLFALESVFELSLKNWAGGRDDQVEGTARAKGRRWGRRSLGGETGIFTCLGHDVSAGEWQGLAFRVEGQLGKLDVSCSN